MVSGWSLLDGLPADGYSALEHWRLRLIDAGDPGAFARFAGACFASAATPTLRAAYDVLDGPWARDWGFRGFVGWLLLRGRASFEATLADPETLADGPFPGNAQDFVMALLEIGMPLPAPVPAATDRSFPRLAAWREARFQPVPLDPAPVDRIARKLLADGRCDTGRWGRFRVRSGYGGRTVTFQPGAPFRGGPLSRDGWAAWYRPLIDRAADHREFVAPGLGAFRLIPHPARRGRNPVTGDTFEIPALRLPRFRPSTELLDRLGEGPTGISG